ncbi:MAG: heparinase II/III family protein [Armatimonadota bacterium]|nr:heparinase II/III family protein [Armatimonadota bacterium]
MTTACCLAQAQERLVFETFESVEGWDGFELATDLAHHGDTSALWRNHPDTPGVSSSEIPHDWSEYGAFTFWVHNERELDARFMCIISSENPATEGIDYWSIGVPLSFTGWKRFGVLIREGSGVRSPRGWDQVDSIRFTASGWGNEPHPEAVVHIDQLELRNDIGGPGPLLSDEELFSLLREDIEGLAAARQAAAAGDYAAAKRALLEYFRARDWPQWTFDPSEYDQHRDPDYNTDRADQVMEHTFRWQGRTATLPEDIDWTFNPWEGDDPNYTPEWTYDLNRFGFWRTLGQAWWATGDDRYAKEFVSQMLDWIHDEPAPVLGSPNTAPTWRTIEQGIRTAGSWMDAYHYFLFADAMTPQAHCAFLKSWVEHARTLTRMTVEHPEHGGNWVTMECNGLAHIGVMFPEFTEAEHWREVAYGRLLMELDRQVYPDGAQKELSTGYHQVARGNFMRATHPASRNGIEIPGGYLNKLRRMYEYNLHAMKPDGRLPPLNDSGDTNVVGALREAYDTWGDQRFLWGATLGAEGEPVDFTSWFFPWAGQAVMRSGWNADDLYMMFEVGPFGIGHQHEDKLGIYLWGWGRPLLTEAGTYSYDRSAWRRFVLSTAAHNTIMVDGMGQHRRGLGETYETDEPLEGVWASTDLFDWCIGRYEEGYGPDRLPLTHERTVIFVKPGYFLVIDRLLGAEGEHTYEALFNFDAEEAAVADDGLTVSSADPGQPNVTLMPLATDDLSLRVVTGQEDPLMGWIPRQDHREIPTAVYERAGPTPQQFVTLLLPHPTEEAPPVEAQVLEQTDEMLAIHVRHEAGEETILYAFAEPMAMQADGVSTQARLAIVRRTDGEVTGGLLEGTELRMDGEPVPLAGQ